jgi:hypothetical protein
MVKVVSLWSIDVQSEVVSEILTIAKIRGVRYSLTLRIAGGIILSINILKVSFALFTIVSS